eukprot:TRINITY_DN3160_c0_g1_i1.p1 TRINITY_DN3160_c0_g1~~TRINITY_DN3160_c0_g1_i1.p1  ORF type:complete len:1415 (-),score=445.20 TRINITY_DN3160_c0_g1_i1:21-4265(-)
MPKGGRRKYDIQEDEEIEDVTYTTEVDEGTNTLLNSVDDADVMPGALTLADMDDEATGTDTHPEVFIEHEGIDPMITKFRKGTLQHRIQKRRKRATALRVARKWLLQIIFLQIVGNFVRAVPIFILEKFFIMIMLVFQFVFLGCGYFGAKRLIPPLIGAYTLGTLATTLTDLILASTYTQAHPTHLPPVQGTVAIWLYFGLVSINCILNLIGAIAFGARIFLSVVLLRNPSDHSLLVLAASLIGSFDDEEDTSKKQVEQHRTLYHRFQGRDTPSDLASTFASNIVKTSKYNPITFFPKVLYLQFSRLANLYTLAIVTLSMFSFSPVGPVSSFTPLLIVITVSAFKEFAEDRKRHKQDSEINNRRTMVFRQKMANKILGQTSAGGFESTIWADVKVGDIVMVENNELIPADMALIASGRADARAYLETANLDGETNLKMRTVPQKCTWIRNEANVASLQCKLDCEGPNNNIYGFDGVLTMLRPKENSFGSLKREISANSLLKSASSNATPITPDSMLLRGTQLRNTPWAYGLVVYTGLDTKVEQNSTETPQKRSAVEKGVNIKLLFLFLLQAIVCVVCSVGHNNWKVEEGPDEMEGHPWYLDVPLSVEEFIYVSYVILYNTLIPLSMYVSMETLRVVNAQFIDADLAMYSEETNTPAQARNTNINEELGQIQYLFTDKTGTLTRNEMNFAQCSISSVRYGGDGADGGDAGEPFSRLREVLKQPDMRGVTAREFMTALAVCNTVVIEQTEDGQPSKGRRSVYQAASPDEEALVMAAAKFGFTLVERENTSASVSSQGQQSTFEILNVLEFNSYRKRMSVICRTPTGDIKLYCKGADTVILARLSQSSNSEEMIEEVKAHLTAFASSGLRTLCVASTIIEPAQYEEWNRRYQEASMSLVQRAEKLDEVAELIERNMTLLGATGIEDRLQEGVADCITALREAGIRVWVLTGDKQETAISIATSSAVIDTSEMEVVILNETTKEGILEKLFEVQRKYNLSTPVEKGWRPIIATYLGVQMEGLPNIPFFTRRKPEPPILQQLTIVIDGSTLDLALAGDVRYHFLKCARACVSVVCCRCSPIQKARVVKLVAEKSLLFGDGAITLSIGDGANDVPMIQKAHVGVGISGKEGMQAVLASDFSIAEFRFLKRLLLVHGNRSYRRITKLILYSFCKNIALCLSQFWFSFHSGFSGQMMYFDFLFTLYNALFTSFPILAVGMLDQDVSDTHLMLTPSMYRSGQLNRRFNMRSFFGWVALGIWQSYIIFSVAFNGMNEAGPTGHPAGLWGMGITAYTVLVLMMTLQITLFTSSWPRQTIMSVGASIVLYGFFIFLLCGLRFVDSAAFLVIYDTMSIPNFWLVIIVAPLIGVMPYLLLRLNKLYFMPELKTRRRWFGEEGEMDIEGDVPLDNIDPNIQSGGAVLYG